jgi:hypothetical protein
MESDPKPVAPEALTGKDELDEDDEMELSSDDLVEQEGN